MPTDTEQKKPASGPKSSHAKHSRSTKKRVSGYRPKARNALYRLTQEYRLHHPKVTAAGVWRHLASVAATGAHDVVLAHDRDAGTLVYRPDPEKFATRSVKFDSFASRLSRLA